LKTGHLLVSCNHTPFHSPDFCQFSLFATSAGAASVNNRRKDQTSHVTTWCCKALCPMITSKKWQYQYYPQTDASRRKTWKSEWVINPRNQRYYCCDRKSRAACVQSFAPWQQATIEITRRDHTIIACSHHAYIFLFFAHIPFVVESHNQRNVTGEVQHYLDRCVTPRNAKS